MTGRILKGIVGDFTIFKFVKDLNRDEIEDKVGFERGRLDDGALIVVLAEGMLMEPDDFELGASTRWSRSSAAAPWAPAYVVNADGTMRSDAIEFALSGRGDLAALKAKVASFFNRRGDSVPAKVLPRRHRHGDLYPNSDGAGVPQFKLKVPKDFIVAREVRGRSGAF